MQQQLRRPHHRLGVKAPLPLARGQYIGQRHQRHADVMGHEVMHDGERPVRLGPGVVHRIAEAERTEQSHPLEHPEIPQRPFGIDHRSQCRGIRSDYQIASQPALERQVGYAESAILIDEMAVAQVVRALTRSPWHAALRAVGDLPPDGAAVGLVEEGERKALHDEKRHEILEHAAAPRHERCFSSGVRERAAESVPVLDWHIVLGDGDEARQARLGSE